MPITYSSLAGSKTRRVETLTSGTSWTVPTGVTFVNATLQGGGGGGSGSHFFSSSQTITGQRGLPGKMITTYVATTPGASVSYAIAAGGTAGPFNTAGGAGGSTTFTGATTATGGLGGVVGNAAGAAGTQTPGFDNGGAAGSPAAGSFQIAGGAGGGGSIVLEYWL